jgi:isopentenyldiphosphate isomerase
VSSPAETGGEGPEMLDVVDPTGQHLGQAPRHEIHHEGRWHQVFHALIVRPGTDGYVVLQRRATAKSSFPDQLDLSATGHLHAGETPVEGIRELNEELGVAIDPEALVPLGVRLLADNSGEGRNRERVHAFFVRDDRPLDQYRPAPDEVSALVEARAGDLLRLLDGSVADIDAVESRNGGPPTPISVTLTDLVNPTDGYWTVILVMAERFAAGANPIAV